MIGDHIEVSRRILERVKYDIESITEWDIEMIIDCYEEEKGESDG